MQYAPGAQLQPQLPFVRQQGKMPSRKQLWVHSQRALVVLRPPLPAAEPLPARDPPAPPVAIDMPPLPAVLLAPLAPAVAAAPALPALVLALAVLLDPPPLWPPAPAMPRPAALGPAPDWPAIAPRPAAVDVVVCALLIEPVRAAAPADGGELHETHSESAPRVGEASLATHARTPSPPPSQRQSTRSPSAHASPVNAGGSGSLGGAMMFCGSLP